MPWQMTLVFLLTRMDIMFPNLLVPAAWQQL
jgi:hypothetical protein